MLQINNELLNSLLAQAAENPRLRQAYDLRTSAEDGSQRILNALMPGTVLPIHRHRGSDETVILLKGHLTEIFYDEDGKVTQQFDLNPSEGRYGVQVPKGAWHKLVCYEPSVVFEAKDGPYEPLAEEDVLNTPATPIH